MKMRIIKFLELCALLSLFISRASSVCPEGFCRHSGACYLTVGLNVGWIDARNYCSVLNGVLFSPTSSTMQNAGEGALRKSKGIIHPGKFWVDITDLLNPKDWKTMSNRQGLSYTNWSPPDADRNETVVQNCVYMSEDSDYQWSIAACDEKLNFVCYSSGLTKLVHRRHYYRYNEDEYEEVDVQAHEVDFDEIDC